MANNINNVVIVKDENDIVLSPSQLLGRNSSTGGNPEAINLGSGLIMSGNTLNVNGGGGITSPEQFAQLQESFNDYQGSGNASSGIAIGGGIGFFASGMVAVGSPVTNPNNAIGVYRISANTINSGWGGIRYSNSAPRAILSGNFADKVNYFIFKRRMKLVSFANNRSFHYGVFSNTSFTSVTQIPNEGVFFRWQTNGTSVINFEAHVRNAGVSTIVTPSSSPSDWSDWFVMELRIGVNGVQFFIDNVAVTGLITTNRPTGFPVIGSQYSIEGWTNPTGDVLDIDWDYARPNV